MELQLEYPAIKFVVQLAVEAIALLVIAAYFASTLRHGRWAVLGVVGGVLAGATAGLFALGWAVLGLSGSNAVFDWITSQPIASFVVDWARPAGLVLICASFVMRRRSVDLPRTLR